VDDRDAEHGGSFKLALNFELVQSEARAACKCGEKLIPQEQAAKEFASRK
jgi:hypothetical protein